MILGRKSRFTLSRDVVVIYELVVILSSMKVVGFLCNIGIISNKKILDLLYLALSVDISNTIRRVKELIGSSIATMALTLSQLETLIMDNKIGSSRERVNKQKGIFFQKPYLI